MLLRVWYEMVVEVLAGRDKFSRVDKGDSRRKVGYDRCGRVLAATGQVAKLAGQLAGRLYVGAYPVKLMKPPEHRS